MALPYIRRVLRSNATHYRRNPFNLACMLSRTSTWQLRWYWAISHQSHSTSQGCEETCLAIYAIRLLILLPCLPTPPKAVIVGDHIGPGVWRIAFLSILSVLHDHPAAGALLPNLLSPSLLPHARRSTEDNWAYRGIRICFSRPGIREPIASITQILCAGN